MSATIQHAADQYTSLTIEIKRVLGILKELRLERQRHEDVLRQWMEDTGSDGLQRGDTVFKLRTRKTRRLSREALVQLLENYGIKEQELNEHYNEELKSVLSCKSAHPRQRKA